MRNAFSGLELVGGLLFSAVVAWVGYRRQSLSKSGVIGALISGTTFFGIGGWEWGLLLIAFFVSSSFLSHYQADKKQVLAEKFSKGSRRDLGQAVANAGVGMGLAVANLFWPSSLFYIACAGAMAAVNADTWATEVGVLSRRMPRSITTGRPVDVGSSGGITRLGITVSAAGAAFIGLLSAGAMLLINESFIGAVAVALGAIVGGVSGSLIDSLLGATVQSIYWCDVCEKETEQAIHRCGSSTRRVRGLSWLGNDGVNFAASVVGAVIAAAVGAVILSG